MTDRHEEDLRSFVLNELGHRRSQVQEGQIANDHRSRVEGSGPGYVADTVADTQRAVVPSDADLLWQANSRGSS